MGLPSFLVAPINDAGLEKSEIRISKFETNPKFKCQIFKAQLHPFLEFWILVI
jgi:hypothetical protein